MLHIKPFWALALVAGIGLSACGGGERWQTSYSDMIDPKVSKHWRVTSVDVRVPDRLTVSEQNSYAPNADIVWREDPLGDRRAQVDAIMTAAVKQGAAPLRGSRRVKLLITVKTFHALSEKARVMLNKSGVHNIEFLAQVIDARTGKPLTAVDDIKADLEAYVGYEAKVAVSKGQTQKRRITDHVAHVISAWLGHGKDVRNSFNRLGR
ncbi:MAG: hypothetical protein CSA68_00990 [Rhodobacterales bacterium]|nr:MAG: hypothetical protein CSA68_00990 [Rhodobacterales bacterium]